MDRFKAAGSKTALLLPVFLICISAFIIIVNLYNPMTGEDFSLAYLLGTDYQSKNIEGKVLAIAKAVKTQSLGWNARLGEQLAIVFLGMNRIAYTAVNTLMAFIFFFLIFKYALGGIKKLKTPAGLLAAVITYSAVVLFLPVLGEIFFLRNTATNYLWAIIIIMIFVMPFFKSAMSETVSPASHFFAPAMFVLGILAGMTNENTGIAVFCGIGSLAAYKFIRKEKIPAWFILGTAGLLLGIAYLLLSPSTAVRVKYYASVHASNGPVFPAMLRRGLEVAKDFLLSGAALLSIFSALLFYHAVGSGSDGINRIKRDGRLGALFVLMFFSLISAAVLMLPPYHETRSFLPVFFCILVIICRLCYLVFAGLTKKESVIFTAAAVIFFGVSLYYSARVVTKYVYFNRECAERDVEIRKKAAAGERIITVSPYKTKIRRYINTRDGYLAWAEQYPAYYKVDKILIENR